MAKPLGSQKTGGRTAGTPNKRTLALIERLEAEGVDPLSRILSLASNLTPAEQIHVHMSLLPYIYPKRRPVESLPPLSLEEQIAEKSLADLKELSSKLDHRIRELGPKAGIESKEDIKSQITRIKDLLRMYETMELLSDEESL